MVTKKKLMEEIRDLENRTLILEAKLEEIGKLALMKAEEPRKESAKENRQATQAQSDSKGQKWLNSMGDFKANHPFRPNQDKEG